MPQETSRYHISTLELPKFSAPLPDFNLTIDEEKVVPIPSIVQGDYDQVDLEVDIGKSLTFVSFNGTAFSMKAKSSDVGMYEIGLDIPPD